MHVTWSIHSSMFLLKWCVRVCIQDMYCSSGHGYEPVCLASQAWLS